jgi:dihydrolipoamide dehydrogenase
MMKQKQESVEALTKGVEFLMKKNKVDYVKGWGRIAGAGKVIVKADDGTETTLETKNIVIATGSEPTPLPGVDHRPSASSTRPAPSACPTCPSA